MNAAGTFRVTVSICNRSSAPEVAVMPHGGNLAPAPISL